MAAINVGTTEGLKMNNAIIAKQLAAKLRRIVNWRIDEMGDTYAQAKAYAMRDSIAGQLVWDMLDAEYA